MPGDPFLLSIATGQVNELALLQPGVLYIFRIHKDDASPVIDATVPIIKTVDRGVELVVAANRHHQILARLEFM